MNLAKKDYLIITCATAFLFCCSCTFLSLSGLILLSDDISQGDCRIDNVPCEEVSEQEEIAADQLNESYFGDENDRLELDLEEEVVIISYIIHNGELDKGRMHKVAPELQGLQDDVNKHHELWDLYYNLFPEEYLGNIEELEITTDGIAGTLAVVYQSQKNIDKWVLTLDIIDAYPREKLDEKELTSTLIHEFAHIFTFDDEQIKYSEEYFYARTKDQVEESLENGRQSCPTYYAIEGCLYADSYLNQFYDEFWIPLYTELKQLEQAGNEDEYYEKVYQLYMKYPDQFVSDYTAAGPEEDIAESWTAFILRDKPTGQTIADDKVRFFYDYPELVKMREEIRSSL